MRILIFIGKTVSTVKSDNRQFVHNSLWRIAQEKHFNNNFKYSISYSNRYYAFIISDQEDVHIDIEKDMPLNFKFNENISHIQDRKLWTIKECASKVCKHGIISILKDIVLCHVTNIGRYEVWKVTLDKKWYPRRIFIFYRFIFRKIHLSFSIDII